MTFGSRNGGKPQGKIGALLLNEGESSAVQQVVIASEGISKAEKRARMTVLPPNKPLTDAALGRLYPSVVRTKPHSMAQKRRQERRTHLASHPRAA